MLIPLLLASCSDEPAEEVLKEGTYFGQGRDALCIVGKDSPQRFAFITCAAKGDTNCAAEGRVEHGKDGWALVPAGEGGCRIPVTANGDTLAFGQVPAACSYYCGPDAAFSGQQFGWKDTSDMLLTQEPLGHDNVC